MFSTLLKWHTTSLGRPASSAAMAAARRGRRSFTYVCQKLRHRLCLRAHRCWSPFAGSGNDTDYGSKVRSCPRTCGGGEAAAAIFFFLRGQWPVWSSTTHGVLHQALVEAGLPEHQIPPTLGFFGRLGEAGDLQPAANAVPLGPAGAYSRFNEMG
jgi:hypothetical protein